jgi:transposase
MTMKKYHVTLSSDERQHLQAIIAKRNAKSQAVKRAYVLLAADENQPDWLKDEQIKATYQVSIRSIERLRERFVEDGLEIALNGKKREKYKEKVFDGAVEAHVVALRCSQPPAGHARWTVRLLAQTMVELEYVEAIGRETVRKMLKKTKSSPGGSSHG